MADDNRRLEDNDLGQVLKRIDVLRAKIGLTDAATSEAAGFSRDALRTMRKQYRRGTQHSMSVRSLLMFAVYFSISARWLAHGRGSMYARKAKAQKQLRVLEQALQVAKKAREQTDDGKARAKAKEEKARAKAYTKKIAKEKARAEARIANEKARVEARIAKEKARTEAKIAKEKSRAEVLIAREKARASQAQSITLLPPPSIARLREGDIVHGIRVTGAVEAGKWVEAAQLNDHPISPIEVPADTRHPLEHQFAVEVRDESVNLIARSGDYLIVSPNMGQPRSGDLVVITRTRDGQSEMSVRRYIRLRSNAVELHNESDHPHFAADSVSLANNEENGVRINGVVISLWRPIA